MAEIVQPAVALRRKRGWSAAQIISFGKKKPLGAIGAVVLILMVIVAVFADTISTHPRDTQNVDERLDSPSEQHYFGSDQYGRDIFTRVVHGSRTSIYVGLFSVAIGTVVGTFIGATSGYLGGKFDLLIQRVVDAMMGFPGLILALVLVASLGASLNNVIIAISVVLTPRMIRLSRSSSLSIREEMYILAAQSIGAKGLRIVLRHVLPNILAPVFVLATGYLGTAIIIEASLSYLGLGVPPPTPSWGLMLNEATKGYLETSWWMSVFPGMALSVVVFSFAMFGDALRDVLDPRLRGA